MDAMRADAASARGTAYNTTVTASACPAATASLSNAQLIQWCNQLGTDLGKAATTTGTILCLANGNCTITITFDDSRAGAGGSSGQTIITTAML
jgi:type IV pilus assembly protein PilV